jgi:hypothetical protein
MFSKMVLPLLGGAPAVWTTCMLFFQVVLLGGYAYAHLLPRWIGPRRHTFLHLVLFLVSTAFLPLQVARGWVPPADANPVPWLVGLLAVSLGIPFFLLSSTGPLLQRWFADSEHEHAANPYFLYSASNVGSMVALLAYPVAFEPLYRLREQSVIWTAGYAMLVFLLGGAAALVWDRMGAPSARAGEDGAADPVPWGGRLRWVALAFVPSSLLLGVTNYLSTDIAAVPLLWVVPLALYLLTFAIVFAGRPPIRHAVVAKVLPAMVVALVLVWFWVPVKNVVLLMPASLLLFFGLALLCHGQLAARRPEVTHLTEYYLWIALGGALGGVFNVIVAPRVFDSIAEFPLMLVLGCIVGLTGSRPAPHRRAVGPMLSALLVGAVLGATAWGMARVGARMGFVAATGVVVLVTSLVAALWYGLRSRPVWFGMALVAVLVARDAASPGQGEVLLADRSFFGVHRVRADRSHRHYVYLHGTTIHGAQRIAATERDVPLSYFSEVGPLGDVFRALRERPGPKRIGVIGLGTGTMAAYGRPGDEWTFYEIDPMVERIARDARFFTFLKDAPAPVRVVLGDGRLKLAAAPPESYDLFIVDAFSSDAIPVHLLSREAVALYRSRLAPSGMMAFNLSNRYLDLRSVTATLFADAGLHGRVREDMNTSKARLDDMIFPSVWAAAAPRSDVIARLPSAVGWRESVAAGPVWTDDFSNVLSAIRHLSR